MKDEEPCRGERVGHHALWAPLRAAPPTAGAQGSLPTRPPFVCL